ncbi:MAG: LacI family transcriptional regulator [bacterium]|nr:LacI family transcriptional regulator [bacterium]
MRPTIKDIARIAGVNISTVSRSLNGSSLISEKTKEKILRIAKELDFEFNTVAQNLTTKQSHIIGVVYPDDADRFALGLFLATMFKNIRVKLEQKSYLTIMTSPESQYDRQSNIKKLINGRNIDGLIIVNWFLDDEDWRCIQNQKIPHVFLHHTTKYSDQSTSILTDNYLGGTLAAKHLISLGHKNIYCIASKDNGIEFILRGDGFLAELKNNEIEFNESNIIYGDHTFDFAYRQTLKLEEELKNNKYSAIFALSDVMAMGVFRACAEMGISIPKDISLMGYDGLEIGSILFPVLTTIKQPVDEMVEEACRNLLHQISKNKIEVKKVLLPPTLVEGETCRKI